MAGSFAIRQSKTILAPRIHWRDPLYPGGVGRGLGVGHGRSGCVSTEPIPLSRLEPTAIAIQKAVHRVHWTVPTSDEMPETSGCDQAPTGRQSWPIGGTDINVVIQVPDRRPASGGIVKQIIRFPVTVKISNPR
jgi:hypothetical protein